MKKHIGLAFALLLSTSLFFAQESEKAKVEFHTWSMIGLQSKFSTQSENTPTLKGFDADSITFGFKSYNKLTGNFLPNSPLFLEICLAETELDDQIIPDVYPIYLMHRTKNGDYTVNPQDGFLDFGKNIISNLIGYAAQSGNNSGLEGTGPGTPAYLGHLKFGIDTPYVNFSAGFNYAKLDLRQPILWKVLDDQWTAGYQHVGGYNQFTMGSRVVSALEQLTGLTFTAGFSPNKSADRKGTLYGHFGWIGVKKGEFALDIQSNGMYDNGNLFYDSVEQDIVFGARDLFRIGQGKLFVGAQGLIAFHQKAFTESENNISADYFGYSSDVFYRSGSFEGIKNMAGQLKASYYTDTYAVNASYRLRGMQASELYVKENSDDGTFDLSEQLGVLNSQNIDIKGYVKLLDSSLVLNLVIRTTLPLENLSQNTRFNKNNYWEASGTVADGNWYYTRCKNFMEPLYNQTGGAELTFKPSVSYSIPNTDMSLSLYGDFNVRAYTYSSGDNWSQNVYESSDSVFRAKKAGLSYEINNIGPALRSVTLYYGLDNTNSIRLFNTLIGEASLSGNIKVSCGVGLKTVKNTQAAISYNKAENNPFAFVLGFAKQLNILQRATIYSQFVYNMDSYKLFDGAQDKLSLDRANVSSRWDDKSAQGTIDAVDYYDGKAAVRVGIRWDI